VTLLTGHLLMFAGERKLGLVVINLGRFPTFRRVARLAVRVPAGVISRRRLVARFAQRRGGLGERLAMTLLTGHLLMLAGEGKLGLVVVHLGRLPTFRRVAHLAVGVPARVIRRGRLVAGFALDDVPPYLPPGWHWAQSAVACLPTKSGKPACLLWQLSHLSSATTLVGSWLRRRG